MSSETKNERTIAFANTHETLTIHSSWDEDDLIVKRDGTIVGGFEIPVSKDQYFEIRRDDRTGLTRILIRKSPEARERAYQARLNERRRRNRMKCDFFDLLDMSEDGNDSKADAIAPVLVEVAYQSKTREEFKNGAKQLVLDYDEECLDEILDVYDREQANAGLEAEEEAEG